MNNTFYYKPNEIENRSMDIITEILSDMNVKLNQQYELIIKRAIHTTADFEYAHILEFRNKPLKAAGKVLKDGCTIITDTKMALSGINKKSLKKANCSIKCFISDEDIVKVAKDNETTRSAASMEKAAKDYNNKIFVIGNAPTALIKLYQLVQEGILNPALIIAMPVGFVNVVEAKELIKKLNVPSIISNGRKGGSNVAAAVMNSILYSVIGR